ncbi:ABC transporter permease [Falsirhodobacter halotolerans]|uniref:ABC transporter permease n=1 Tax=Falsirhodobacter halotolerans TaxID=1146892 RepID=UPI001FD452FF|nr:ABC transporter permease [Falsirhodobacter halotolerans]
MTAAIQTSALRFDVLRRLFRNRTVLVAAIVLTIIALAAIFAPWVAPYDPDKLSIVNRFKDPSFAHPFGTDEFGRDVLSRAIYAGRVSLLVSAAVVVFAGVAGIIMGILAGYFRKLDAVISRFLDAMMAFPDILLAIALVAALGGSLTNVILALGVTYTPRLARVVRGTTLVLRELPYIEAAKSMGIPTWRILSGHVLVNLASPILVQATFIFASAMLAEASLSFLGVGASPDVPTWGTMLSTGREYISSAPWLMYFPGLAIVFAVLSLQILGDGLRDLVDPRLAKDL